MDALVEPSRFAALAWLVIGLTLCAVETLVPGAFFIWFGAAAAIVGVADYLLPMRFETQLVLFGALVAALVLIGRGVYGSLSAEPGPLPQSRAHAMVGADFYLDEPIVRGYGRIRVGDSSWRIAGPDCPAGARVRVVAVEDGSLLKVERAEGGDGVPPVLPQR
jgi:membrane protein implicated in regulation of membrane protease activity